MTNDPLILEYKAEADFQPCPSGDHKAVLVDVIKSDQEPSFYGPKDHVYLVFELEAEKDNGFRWTLNYRATASMHPKANLNKFLAKWRGKAIEKGEKINMRSLIGKCCILEVEHTEGNDGRTWANIDRARPLTKAQWIKPKGEYDGERERQRITERVDKRRQMDGYTSDDEPAVVASDPPGAIKQSEKKKPKPVLIEVDDDADDVPF